jgi:hypothetical protein
MYGVTIVANGENGALGGHFGSIRFQMNKKNKKNTQSYK